jgi:hypothetical protein
MSDEKILLFEVIKYFVERLCVVVSVSESGSEDRSGFGPLSRIDHILIAFRVLNDHFSDTVNRQHNRLFRRFDLFDDLRGIAFEYAQGSYISDYIHNTTFIGAE